MACNQRCDINTDGVVDARDRSILMSAYGSKWGDSNYNRLCDFNGDGLVDGKDLAIFEDSFGCTFDVPTPPQPVCTPLDKRCVDSTTKEVCKYDGSEWIRTSCGSDYECIDGEFVSRPPPQVCTPGARRCKDATTAEVCRADGSGWDLLFCNVGHECKDGYCVPVVTPPPIVCTPRARRCRDSKTIEVCKSDGTGWYTVTCPTGHECKDGYCVPVVTPPPTTETRTTSLTEGNHSIQVSLSGYDTLQATINVSSTGVTCVSVVGGACGGSGLPRISTSGWTVTTYLKTGTGETARCAWIATKDTSKVVFISEMVLAYSGLQDIGFIPTASEIGQAVLMYSKLGTPETLWGC